MDIATAYGAWQMYKYITAAYSTYETVVAVYGTACAVVTTTGAVISYVMPRRERSEKCLVLELEHDDEWELVDIL